MMRWAAILFLAWSSLAFADSTATTAVGVIGAVGGATAVSAAAMNGLLKYELKDWTSNDTGTTSQMTRNCDINAEIRLIGTSRKNFVYFGLKNDSSSDVVVKAGEVRIDFENGRERSATFPFEVSDYELKAGWKVLGLAPFPEKYDLKDQASMRVVIPIYDHEGHQTCSLESTLRRRPVQSPESYTVYPVLTYSFEFGSTLSHTNTLVAAGDPGFAFGVFLYGYGGIHHGFFLGVNMDDFSNSIFPTLRFENVNLGYSYRTFLSKRLDLVFDVGPGMGYFASDAGNSNNYGLTTFTLYGKASIDFRFATIDRGLLPMDNMIGLSVFDTWISDGNAFGYPASGHDLGILVRYVFGF